MLFVFSVYLLFVYFCILESRVKSVESILPDLTPPMSIKSEAQTAEDITTATPGILLSNVPVPQSPILALKNMAIPSVQPLPSTTGLPITPPGKSIQSTEQQNTDNAEPINSNNQGLFLFLSHFMRVFKF